MNVSVRLFFYLRLSFVFITVLVLCYLYKDYNLIHFIPVVLIDCISLFISRVKSKQNSKVKVTRRRGGVCLPFSLLCL